MWSGCILGAGEARSQIHLPKTTNSCDGPRGWPVYAHVLNAWRGRAVAFADVRPNPARVIAGRTRTVRHTARDSRAFGVRRRLSR